MPITGRLAPRQPSISVINVHRDWAEYNIGCYICQAPGLTFCFARGCAARRERVLPQAAFWNIMELLLHEDFEP